MSKPTIVKFIKPWNGYGPKEIAGFSAELAERLVQAGVAELNGKVKAEKPQQQKSNNSNTGNSNGNNDSSNNPSDASAADDQDDKKP